MTVLIAGAGIAGLSMALTCHQLGVKAQVFEASGQLRPLGVGINLQPNAVRELFEMGFEETITQIGIPTKDYGFYTRFGLEIWTERRGRWAGYQWPQYSVHRGKLQMMLAQAVLDRLGPDAIQTGWRLESYRQEAGGVSVDLVDKSGTHRHASGTILVAADGVHSAVRSQMYPDEGPAIWSGAVLWRGTTMAQPFLSGASMALAGHATQRIVTYPLSAPDPDTGLALINWIAEKTYDPSIGWQREDWNRKANLDDFLPDFESWRFDWLDVPALIRGADEVFEYPMVDRDPLDSWTDGAVTLIGDAAHVTYPVGSSGASQAIVDARMLGAALAEHGLSEQALHAYEDKVRPVVNKVVLANRGSGPDAIMQRVEDLSGGQFDDIESVIPKAELAKHAAHYKELAGFSIEALNKRPAIIAVGAKVR